MHNLFVMRIACLVNELHASKPILEKRQLEVVIVRTIVSEDYLLFSSFSYIGGRLDCKDCMYATRKYSKELSVCIF